MELGVVVARAGCLSPRIEEQAIIRSVVGEMCLDHCEWLWQALFRPIPSVAPGIHSGELGSVVLEHDDTMDGEGSPYDVPLTQEAINFVTGDGAIVAELLHRLSSGEIDEQRAASKELRHIAKESPEINILIASAGSIPLLVGLLSTRDPETREHAVTLLLNLSILSANKIAIVLAGAVDAIVEVLKSGSMEARENAAATLFSLSVLDENKVTIGKSGALPALVELLKDGTTRGKNDAASALFNLSLNDGNKRKAVAAGVLSPLVKLLSDSGACMVDVALAILSLFAMHKDSTGAVVDAYVVPVLIDLIRSGSPGNRENSVAVLLALSKHDPAQASLAKQLGAMIYVAELSRCGIPRARKKATQLLELLNAVELNPS